jgi:hypothetical protein
MLRELVHTNCELNLLVQSTPCFLVLTIRWQTQQQDVLTACCTAFADENRLGE